MKKVSSSASYSQFRKKTPNNKQQHFKEQGFNQIDQLTKQLQAINSYKKVNNSKYEHPNGIKEEQEEDDSYALVNQIKNKTQNNVIKKLKGNSTKLDVVKNKAETNSKLNKSTEGPLNVKKQKQKNPTKQVVNMKAPTKLPRKEEQKTKIARKMSLTNLYAANNPKNINQSLNTTTSQSQQPLSISKKNQIINKLQNIQSKLLQKAIPAHFIQQIMEKIERIDQILQDC